MIKAVVADEDFLDMRYIYDTDGNYLGAFNTARIKTKFEGIEVIDGPAPAHVKDKLVNGELVPYVEPKSDEQKANEIIHAVSQLPEEVLVAFAGVIGNIHPFMVAGNWKIVKALMKQVPTDNPIVAEALKTIGDIIDS